VGLVFAKENLLAYLRNEKLKGKKKKSHIKKWGWFFAKENCFCHTCTRKNQKEKKFILESGWFFATENCFWHTCTIKNQKEKKFILESGWFFAKENCFGIIIQ